MTIYINNDFKCYVENAEDRRAIETDVFDGKCQEYIERFRYVPHGETWTREDGEVFSGTMVTPWANLNEAYEAQAAYLESLLTTLQKQMTDMQAALDVLEVSE